ncbi:hypothetical protein [Bacillus kexueae]|nr:hypothetical protein [Bacillus kexueae]
MLWKSARPKKLIGYAQLLAKMNVLSDEQMKELEKALQKENKTLNRS